MAPILCASVTTYKGIKETEAKPGEWLAISGIGGLGHVAIQYAKAMGLHVVALDVTEQKLALARALGADIAINAKGPDAAAQVVKQNGRRRARVLVTRGVTTGIRAISTDGSSERYSELGRPPSGATSPPPSSTWS